jgi:hypothetical protein
MFCFITQSNSETIKVEFLFVLVHSIHFRKVIEGGGGGQLQACIRIGHQISFCSGPVSVPFISLNIYHVEKKRHMDARLPCRR